MAPPSSEPLSQSSHRSWGVANKNMDAVEVTTSGEPRAGLGHVCRVCLLDSDLACGLFHGDGLLSLADKAMAIASVKMEPGDGLPTGICCECSDKLEAAYKFKLQVEQADALLREKLDSLNMKEDIFFSDDLSHRGDVGEITEESLLLKDHMDLLNAQKISERDDVLQSVEKEECEIEVRQKEEQEEDDQAMNENEQIDIQEDQQMQEMECQQQLVMDDDKNLHEIHDEQHNQSYEAQELQEMMFNEMNNQEVMQEELNQSHQLAMHEHNYVVESQTCDITTENDVENDSLNQEEIKEDGEMENHSKENIEEQSMNGESEILNVPQESFSNLITRRSKRKINQQKSNVDRDSDEENYFENLNLSSRLKQVQMEKTEKVYYLCYLCEKQFISKEVLKEHMHSHEEVRKTLSSTKKNTEKVLKTPEKPQSASPTLSKPPSSGKRPNTCPHCGKEYLYIISYNKHLKQHEKEKSNVKEENMPLEVSFHEDDDALDFHDYENNPTVDSDSEDEEKKEETGEQIRKTPKKLASFKCNICDEKFVGMEKLKDHRSKHVVEGVLTEQDLRQDEEQFSAETIKIKEDESSSQEEGTEVKQEGDTKELKCPHCPMRYAHKKSLARHMESHCGTKYSCKLCHQSFTRKDHLRRHAEQHGNRLKSFRCTQCNKSFGNELTLRNHLIATNHKTIVHGQEYDPNKRIKRVAAKAAQRIIDQIKTDLNLDEEDEDDEEQDSDRDKVYECDIKSDNTGAEDEQLESSKKHRRSSGKSLYCETCNQRCTSKQALTRHMAQHVKDESTSKQQEKFKKEQLESMETEAKEEEDDMEEDDDNFEGGLGWLMDKHECPTCKKCYSTKKSLLRHQLLHEEPNFECDICNVKFYRKDKLKAHYDKCSEKNPDQVRMCNICGDSFENNEILKEHRAKHVTEGILTEEDLREIEPRPEDKNGEKPPRKRRTDIVGLECTECNKRYTSRKGLLRHIQVHEGKKYLCDICPKKFYRREHLKIHVAKHNMIKPYKCPRCSKRFIKEEQLNSHVTKHDRPFKKTKDSSSSKRFLCEICSKSFTQSTTLIAHLRAHNGIKPYVCEVCSRPFTTNAYLKMHMRTHTQERPYICQYCSSAFARADTLANHLTSHTGEAKYHCKYCPKHFRRLKSLKEHVFIHTGQRPYACPTCDRRFNNNGSRYAHSKRCKQNLLQGRPPQLAVQMLEELRTEQSQPQEQEEVQEQQLQLHEQEIQQRIHHATIGQAQIIKPQNIKTITIARSDHNALGQHVMAHQEILMPLILPLTVTLTDVGEEVILPEGTKIFTA